MTKLIIFGDVLCYAAGAATVVFSAKIKAWLAAREVEAVAAAKTDAAKAATAVAADIKSKL